MRRSVIVPLAILVAVLCVSVNVAFGQKPSSEPGQQVITARWTDTPALIDGVRGPGEYSAAIPVPVTFVQPTTTPGIIPAVNVSPLFTPSVPDDLSFTIYAMYDDGYLYIAVDVADDVLWADGGPAWGLSHDQAPWTDDSVELYIDGDDTNNDTPTFADGSKEGFQIIKGWGGGELTTSQEEILWEAASGDRPRGYMVEFRIDLNSIDTIDGEGEAPPGSGDSIGFTVAVGDDDNGGLPYNLDQFFDAPGEFVDTFGIWDGNPEGGPPLFTREEWWGTLYFDPKWAAKPALSLQPSTWGQIKATFQE